MPTIDPPAKILVTGASGFIACWIIKTLLGRGYAVRGTVRSLKKGEHLQKLFTEYHDGGKFELVVVEDIAKVGCYGGRMSIWLGPPIVDSWDCRKELLTKLLKASMVLYIRRPQFTLTRWIHKAGGSTVAFKCRI
jgi:hypothetical protein